jgi:hypothetical protein
VALLIFLRDFPADGRVGRSELPNMGCPGKRGAVMRDRSFRKAGKRWPGADRWQVTLSALSLLVAVVALVEQVRR